MAGRLERWYWDLDSRSRDDSLADPRIVGHVDELVGWLASALPDAAIVADLGCGTGTHAAALHRAAGAHVVGLDGSPGMLGRARGKGVAVARADLTTTLPLRTAGLDGAWSIYVAQFLELGPFLAEAHRILRPASPFLIEVPRPDIGIAATAARSPRLSLRYRGFRRVKQLTVAIVGRPLGRVRPTTGDELTEALERAGFEVRSARRTTHSTVVLATT